MINIAALPIEINYQLTERPKVADTYINVSSLALFLDKNNPYMNPPIPPAVNIPYFEPEGKDIQIMLSSILAIYYWSQLHYS